MNFPETISQKDGSGFIKKYPNMTPKVTNNRKNRENLTLFVGNSHNPGGDYGLDNLFKDSMTLKSEKHNKDKIFKLYEKYDAAQNSKARDRNSELHGRSMLSPKQTPCHAPSHSNISYHNTNKSISKAINT